MKQNKPKKHRISPEGKAALAASGSANLRAWVLRSGGVAALIAKDNTEALARVDEMMARTIATLGGQASLSPKQEHILACERLALIVIHQAEAHLRRKGLLVKRSRPDPMLTVMASYMNVVRLNLRALGLSDDDGRSAADQAALDDLLDYGKKDGDDGEAESNRNATTTQWRGARRASRSNRFP